MIQSKDISVVVQGPIHKPEDLTKRVLESVRKHLPDAELILSTWKGSDLSGLNYDVLAENDDPGKMEKILSGSENILRQIVSTISGLQKSSKKYVLKIRTDTLICNAQILENVSSYIMESPRRFLNWYIFTTPKFFRNPRYFYKRLYHPSDIIQFGLRNDLLSIWDVAVSKDKSIFVTTEQYLWLSFLTKNGISIDYYANKSKWVLFQDVIRSEKLLVEHFIILSEEQIGVVLPQKFIDPQYAPNTVYTEKDFFKLRALYKKKPILTSISLLLEVYLNGLRNKLHAHIKQIFRYANS